MWACINIPSASAIMCLFSVGRYSRYRVRQCTWWYFSEISPISFPRLNHIAYKLHATVFKALVPFQLLVAQLRRYRRGNKEPFVGHLSGLGESSVSLGAVFPATYYQPVRVCCNCYRVYSMIYETRTKSVRRLDAQAAAAAPGGGGEPRNTFGRRRSSSNNSNNVGTHLGERQRRSSKRARDGAGPRRGEKESFRLQDSIAHELGANNGSRGGRQDRGALQAESGCHPLSHLCGSGDLRRDGDDEPDRTEEESESLSGESLALMRAQAAIDGLTRGDICELRSFAKPPAAVNMVAAALMIALTGQGEPTAAGWLSAKRYMTNIDRLFAAVAGLDLSSLRVSQTRKLESYARNPAFRPDVIACVSLPASKICAWVLGVLVSWLGFQSGCFLCPIRANLLYNISSRLLLHPSLCTRTLPGVG